MKYNINNVKKLENFIDKLKHICHNTYAFYDNEEKNSKYIIKNWKTIFKILLIDQLKWKYNKNVFEDISEHRDWNLFEDNINNSRISLVQEVYKVLSDKIFYNLHDVISYNTYMKLLYLNYSNKTRRYLYNGLIFDRDFNPFIKNKSLEYVLICKDCKKIINKKHILIKHERCGNCIICNNYITEEKNTYKTIIDNETKLTILSENFSNEWKKA